MFENQIATLTTILKDKDIHNYMGDTFWNIIKAVSLGDIGALLDSSIDIKNMLFHAPSVLFWDKVQRYMFGTFRNYAEQVKMAGKFNEENMDYEKFVKRQIHLINEINDDKKVDYFAQLTRCYLLTEMENALYYKLARFLIMCTPEELDYIASFDYEETTNLTAMVSSLYQYGLFERLNDLKRWERNPNCPCEIELYKDSAPYSFLFRQRYADGSTGIVGGLVYHGTPDRSGCYCEPRIRGWEIHT